MGYLLRVIRKTKQLGIISVMLVAIVMVSPIAPVAAEPQTMLNAPTIVDTSLTPGSFFSIEITVKHVSGMLGYQFILSYNTSVLTATGFVSYAPFTEEWPSKINDTAGYAYMAYTYPIPEYFGFDTFTPKPIARIDFTVDDYGYSLLDLHDTLITDIYGGFISHKVGDGFFANIEAQIPNMAISSATLPETPKGTSSGIYSIPTPRGFSSELADELNPPPRWYAGVWLRETYSAKGVSASMHTYKNYVSEWPFVRDRFVAFHIALKRSNVTHIEYLEVGFFQDLSGFFLYSGWRIQGVYDDFVYSSTSALKDHSFEIVETTDETFEARIDSNSVKSVTFSIHGDREYSAFAESTNQGINSLRGHFWNLKYYDSNGVSHIWQQVEIYEDWPYLVGFSGGTATDDFYTSGGGVQGDINGDGVVDVLDVGELNAYWWNGVVSGLIGYDSNADILPVVVPDGFVDIFDAAWVNYNWGKTV